MASALEVNRYFTLRSLVLRRNFAGSAGNAPQLRRVAHICGRFETNKFQTLRVPLNESEGCVKGKDILSSGGWPTSAVDSKLTKFEP